MSFLNRFLLPQLAKSDQSPVDVALDRNRSASPVSSSVPSITVTVDEQSEDEDGGEDTGASNRAIATSKNLLSPSGHQRKGGSNWTMSTTTRIAKKSKSWSYLSATSFIDLTATSARMGGSNGFIVDLKKLNSLHRATYEGDAERILGMLIKGKKDVNKLDRFHLCTATAIAATMGSMAALEVLLAKRPNINLVDSAGRTPLILASIEGHHAVVKLLM
ncbi:hypothetical protein M427DRAFT_137181 [Gonapodya prolifera JEL478]|uniref:Uncharacterized protein n=1 Tax=Gonapodya prolifera (strain JEL478) TaxID=1344416 RepID=A0A139A768_GONPJ|nr:hypothetical protein M427DRAFT_137181 [Gonapodya prolifera JEL478]|eukprot:KXS12666.1 hypothetical protein M427DRAFT_137181 [Gonapodya prolifera JEL478]